MQAKLNLYWQRIKETLKNNRGEADIKTVVNILFTPIGYRFLKNNIEKYGAQLGMLNQLLKKDLILDKEHYSINQDLKKIYGIKEKIYFSVLDL